MLICIQYPFIYHLFMHQRSLYILYEQNYASLFLVCNFYFVQFIAKIEV